MIPISRNPPGLVFLRIAIAGHAFAWYTLYNLLVLWLVSQGWRDGDAASAFGNLVFAAYLLPLLGGVVADGVKIGKFSTPPLGLRRTAILGAALATLGYSVLTLTSHALAGVSLIALGCGFVKPTVTTMVGRLFPSGGHLADAAYSRFYAAINAGAVLSPLLGGWLAQRYGFTNAFAVGALGDVVAGLAILAGYHSLAVADSPSPLAAVLAAAAEPKDVPSSQPLPHDRRKTAALLLFFGIAAIGFWPAYSQNGSGLNLWALRHTDLVLNFSKLQWFIPEMPDSLSIPPAWFAAVNSILCIVAASPIVALFGRGRLSVTAVLGYGLVVASSLCIVVAPTANASPVYLLSAVSFGTAAEILISTIGMAQVSRLAPRESATTWMAIMYLTIAIGGKLAGVLGSMTAGRSLQGGFVVLAVVGFGAGVASWLLRRRLDVGEVVSSAKRVEVRENATATQLAVV